MVSAFLDAIFGFYGRFNRFQYASTIVISDIIFMAWTLFCSVLIYNSIETGIAESVVRSVQMIGALVLVVINVAATTRRMRDIGMPPWIQVCPWTLTFGSLFDNRLAVLAWFLSFIFFVALSILPPDSLGIKKAAPKDGQS